MTGFCTEGSMSLTSFAEERQSINVDEMVLQIYLIYKINALLFQCTDVGAVVI